MRLRTVVLSGITTSIHTGSKRNLSRVLHDAMKGRILLFTIQNSPSSHHVIDFLNDRKLDFQTVDLDVHQDIREDVLAESGRKTVPLLFFNQVCLGGWEEISNMATEEVDKLVGDVNSTEPSDKIMSWIQQIEEGVVESGTGGEDDVSIFSDGNEVKNAVNKDDQYLLQEDQAPTTTAETSTANTVPTASQMAKEIRMLMLSLKGNHISEDGKKVDYKKMAEDPEFKVFKEKTLQLKDVSLNGASRDEKIALFINLYNALVIHSMVEYGPPTNMLQRYKFFNTASYVIDGHRYTLQDMENGVLRANRKAMGAFRKPFSSGDPRLEVALKECEPRVHFALVCGAKSCPPIGTYQVEKIDKQLDLATKSFISGDDVLVNISKQEVQISQIFKWYSVDFGNNKNEIVQWIHNHLGEGEKKTQLHQLLEGGKFKLSHLPYNWDLNKK